MNLLRNTTALNQYLLLPYLHEDAIGIDATCGNGNDTLFLAKHCKEVYAFDIQQVAIDHTRKVIEEAGYTNVTLVHDSFVNMQQYVKEADVIMFNLGYLPEGDKSITTRVEDTLVAIKQALTLLRVDGCVGIMLYWVHEDGKVEREEVLKLVEALNSKQYHSVYLTMPNQKKSTPEIVMVMRKI